MSGGPLFLAPKKRLESLKTAEIPQIKLKPEKSKDKDFEEQILRDMSKPPILRLTPNLSKSPKEVNKDKKDVIPEEAETRFEIEESEEVEVPKEAGSAAIELSEEDSETAENSEAPKLPEKEEVE